MHSQNKLCRVPAKNTRWRFGFVECLTTGTRQTITAVSRFDGWRTRRPRAQMLPSACPAELGTGILCRVLDFCRVLELGKNGMYRVRNLCRVPGARHSAKSLFAECPWFGTRQITKHSAYMPFPVVPLNLLIGLSCAHRMVVSCTPYTKLAKCPCIATGEAILYKNW